MPLQRQYLVMRLIVVGAFVFCGVITYFLAHWLIWNDAAYKRLFWSPFKSFALLASMIDRIGVWYPLGVGLTLGLCVVAVHARRWLLLPVIMLLLSIGILVIIAVE